MIGPLYADGEDIALRLVYTAIKKVPQGSGIVMYSVDANPIIPKKLNTVKFKISLPNAKNVQ